MADDDDTCLKTTTEKVEAHLRQLQQFSTATHSQLQDHKTAIEDLRATTSRIEQSQSTMTQNLESLAELIKALNQNPINTGGQPIVIDSNGNISRENVTEKSPAGMAREIPIEGIHKEFTQETSRSNQLMPQISRFDLRYEAAKEVEIRCQRIRCNLNEMMQSQREQTHASLAQSMERLTEMFESPGARVETPQQVMIDFNGSIVWEGVIENSPVKSTEKGPVGATSRDRLKDPDRQMFQLEIDSPGQEFKDSVVDMNQREAPIADEGFWEQWRIRSQEYRRRSEALLKEMQRTFYGNDTLRSAAPISVPTTRNRPNSVPEFLDAGSKEQALQLDGSNEFFADAIDDDDESSRESAQSKGYPTEDSDESFAESEFPRIDEITSFCKSPSHETEVILQTSELMICDSAANELGVLIKLLIELMEMRIARIRKSSRADVLLRSMETVEIYHAHKVFEEMPAMKWVLFGSLDELGMFSFSQLLMFSVLASNGRGAAANFMLDTQIMDSLLIPYDRGKKTLSLCGWKSSIGSCIVVASNMTVIFDRGGIYSLLVSNNWKTLSARLFKVYTMSNRAATQVVSAQWILACILIFDPGGFN